MTNRTLAAWGVPLGVSAVLAGFATRYAAGVKRAGRSRPGPIERLQNLGEVAEVSILPLVERLTVDDERLVAEPGVSYLVHAGNTRLLFDCGLSGGRAPSALAANADALGVDLTGLDAVVISHLHGDHVGGVHAALRHTFAFSRDPLEPRGIPAYVPTAGMHHARAEVIPTVAPRAIAPGMAVLSPQPRMLFWLGYTVEQALVVNVRGFGLVLISGCGHPLIERVLGVAEQVLDVPIQGVVGGLHLPVHPVGTPLLAQAVFGSPYPPWRLIGERDAHHVLDEIAARDPKVVALSPHDSTPWIYDACHHRFGDRYRTLRVGEALCINASSLQRASNAKMSVK